MTRFSRRALAGAAITVLLGSFAVVPAFAEPATVAFVGITEGASFPYGEVPATVGCTTTAVDELGAVLPCVVEGLLPTVGTHVLTARVAGASVGTLTYTVTKTWELKGFYGPVKEHSTWNSRKGGSTVPLKFKIYEANGVKTHDKADIASFIATPIPCANQTVAAGTKTFDFKTVTTKGRTLKYRDGAFHQNWKTPKAVYTKAKGKAKKVLTPLCYQVTMTAVDGQAIIALFRLK